MSWPFASSVEAVPPVPTSPPPVPTLQRPVPTLPPPVPTLPPPVPTLPPPVPTLPPPVPTLPPPVPGPPVPPVPGLPVPPVPVLLVPPVPPPSGPGVVPPQAATSAREVRTEMEEARSLRDMDSRSRKAVQAERKGFLREESTISETLAMGSGDRAASNVLGRPSRDGAITPNFRDVAVLGLLGTTLRSGS